MLRHDESTTRRSKSLWQTMGAAWCCRWSISCFNHSSRRGTMVWGWASPSAVRLWNRTVESFGTSQIPVAEPCFASLSHLQSQRNRTMPNEVVYIVDDDTAVR